MEEKKICPVCGSEMLKLTKKYWRCKCGHREKSKQSDRTEDEDTEKEYRVRYWEETKNVKKNKKRDRSYGENIVNTRKRTSV